MISPYDADCFNVYDRALKINKKMRTNSNVSKLVRLMPFYRYRTEFCTVKINLGRGTAKTKYIQNRAMLDDMILTQNYRSVQENYKSFSQAYSVSRGEDSYYNGIYLPDDAIIFVDDYDEIIADGKHDTLMLILARFFREPTQTVVLLG